MLRGSNETLSRVTFECDSAVSIIRESDQLKYPRYTVLEIACGKESVIARSCREVDYVTKGSPLGDTLSLSCEASVGTSGSNN